MSKIEVWGRATSSNVQIVMWAVNELGLEHQRFDVGGAFGGTDTAEYRAMNPMGLVPVLRDGETVLFESGAILRYLGARYGDDGFFPEDTSKRAELDQWAEWSKTTLYPVLIKNVFWQLIRTPSAERDHSAIEAGSAELMQLMPLVEKRLGEGPFLNGEALSFADISFGHLLYRYFTLDFDRADTPLLQAYYARLQDRSAYREYVMVDYMGMKVD